MSNRAEKYEAFLDELGPIVDGDADALARHADFLADDDEARDLRHEAATVAAEIRWAGADYVPPADLEARLLAALDARGDGGGRTTSPGFAPPEVSSASAAGSPGFAPADVQTPSAGGWDAIPPTPAPRSPASEPVVVGSSPGVVPVEPTYPPVAAAYPTAQGYGTPGHGVPSVADAAPVPMAATREASSPVVLPPVSATHVVTRPGYSTAPTVQGAIHAPTMQAPPPAVVAAPAKSRRGLLLLLPIGGVALAAAAALAFFVLSKQSVDVDGPTEPPLPALATSGIDGTLELTERAAADGQQGVTIRRPDSSTFVSLAPGEGIPTGSVVRTDERTRARVLLGDGSRLVLNHDTELELVSDAPRTVRVQQGELVAEVAHLEGAPRAFFRTATGQVEVLGTKFELSATSDVTSVRVMRGAVSVAGAEGQGSEVRAGEEGVVRAQGAPEVAPVTELARQTAWSELGDSAVARADEGDVLPGVGSLRARRPGEQQDRERPLTLAQHTVRVRIVGNVARTEIEEVFRNDGDQTLEGIYRFPLPPDAQIARLALDVEGRMEEGSFVERDRAAQIWRGVIRNATPTTQRRNDEEFIWVPGPWRDPAILEWQRGGQFELRIFPIPARSERRVILAYTQNVAPQGGRRRYVYPLAHSADGSTRVGRFDVDVRVAGAERVTATGYRVSSAAEADATRLQFSEEGFQPKGDLVIEYELPGAARELSYWTYRGEAATPPPEASREQDREVLDLQRQLAQDGRPYVAFALRPRLPRAAERRDRDYVVIVDASQSMVGERYERASRLVSRVVAELDRRDRVAVLACDYGCRAMPGGLQAPTAQQARDVASWLDGIEPAGASDLVAVLREAAAAVRDERRDGRELHFVYVGDGTATVGYRRASSVAAEVRALAQAERIVVSTVGVGSDADALVLSALARASGGHYVPYVPGQPTAVAAFSVLEATYGVSLESPRVELPAGLVDAAPTELPTLRAGQEVVFAARMEGERVNGDVVLRGTVAGRPFEQRYPVELVASDAAGNRFVPRTWAAAQIDELQLRGRGDERARIVAMSKAFGVMSRHTSLLVLESEAMFRAFRVDRHEGAPVWTGEEDVVGGGSDGVVEMAGGGVGQGFGGLSGMSRDSAAVEGRGRGARPAAPGLASAPPAPTRASSSEVVDGWSANDADRSPRREAAGGGGGWQWGDMPAPAAPPVASPPVAPMPTPRPQRPGQWMRRVWYRVGEVQPVSEVGSAERQAADAALRALDERPDSRDRHREAVRQLSRAGDLTRALEVAEAWVARDRLDAEALTAKADILGRLGRRDAALRTLTGTVDLSPSNEALHLRLARAFERAGRLERACAHRIAIAENDESNAEALASAMRCERELGRTEAADRLMAAVREPSVRTRAERALGQAADEGRRFGGELTVEAEWDEQVDLDLGIVTSQGTRLSWMGGRTTVEGQDAWRVGREQLALRFVPAGTYYVEVSRTDPTDTRPVRGTVRIRVLDETRTVQVRLVGERATVARVRVTRESRLEPVTGTVNPGW